MVRKLRGVEVLNPDEAADIRALIPKLKEQAKANEDLLETEELTMAEAEVLFEEATGLLRAGVELKDKLEGKGGKGGPDEFKKMLNTQKLVDEKNFQQLLRNLK